MTKLVMISWKKGLRTVSLIDAVRGYSTGSLISARAEVERLPDQHIGVDQHR